MLPTKAEMQNNLNYILCKYPVLKELTGKNATEQVDASHIEYAKWYAIEVIKHCAEVAKVNPLYGNSIEEIDKQSILNIINEL